MAEPERLITINPAAALDAAIRRKGDLEVKTAAALSLLNHVGGALASRGDGGKLISLAIAALQDLLQPAEPSGLAIDQAAIADPVKAPGREHVPALLRVSDTHHEQLAENLRRLLKWLRMDKTHQLYSAGPGNPMLLDLPRGFRPESGELVFMGHTIRATC